MAELTADKEEGVEEKKDEAEAEEEDEEEDDDEEEEEDADGADAAVPVADAVVAADAQEGKDAPQEQGENQARGVSTCCHAHTNSKLVLHLQVKPKRKKKKKGEKVITLPNCVRSLCVAIGLVNVLSTSTRPAFCQDQILPYLYLGGMAAATDVEGSTPGQKPAASPFAAQLPRLVKMCCCDEASRDRDWAQSAAVAERRKLGPAPSRTRKLGCVSH